MSYKEYTVKDYENGDRYWIINGKSHREDGPAMEYANGGRYWYLNGERLTEQEFNKRQNPNHGKIVEIDGIKYELKMV